LSCCLRQHSINPSLLHVTGHLYDTRIHPACIRMLLALSAQSGLALRMLHQRQQLLRHLVRGRQAKQTFQDRECARSIVDAVCLLQLVAQRLYVALFAISRMAVCYRLCQSLKVASRLAFMHS